MDEENKSRFGKMKSFKEAGARMKIGAMQSLSKIEDWYNDQEANLQSKIDDAAKETENKDFFGNLATIGTTLGCMAFGPGLLGACAVAGTIAGGVTRVGVDVFGDAEKGVERFNAEPPKTKYYRDKAPELADKLNDYADSVSDALANEWKADLLKQFGDTLSAAKLGSGLDKLGVFEAFNPVDSGVEPASVFLSETFDVNMYDNVGVSVDIGDSLDKVVMPKLDFKPTLGGV